MIIKGNFPFLKETGHVISLVGGGGKTTLMYAFAEHYAKRGLKTLATTTTHIFRPEETLWAKTAEEAEELWRHGSYAVAGRPAESGKLAALPETELAVFMEKADVVLIEADGAKRLPCKVPASHEPVIPDFCDIVIGVMGMDAAGKPLSEICFRPELAAELLHTEETDVLTPEGMAEILASERGARKLVGGRDYYVVLNKCDDEERICIAEKIRRLLSEKGVEHCVIACLGKEPVLRSERGYIYEE